MWTGVAVGTVKARLSRGRAALAEILGSQLQEADNA
jgi:DNA-directed RNA polymerase specialized sigma24 family protein